MPPPVPGPGDDDAKRIGQLIALALAIIAALVLLGIIVDPFDGPPEGEPKQPEVCISVGLDPEDRRQLLCPPNTPPENWDERGCTKVATLGTLMVRWNCRV